MYGITEIKKKIGITKTPILIDSFKSMTNEIINGPRMAQIFPRTE